MKPLNFDPNVDYLSQAGEVDIPEWRKSLGAFGYETAAFGQGLKALGAQALGMNETRDTALKANQENLAQAQSGWRTPEVGRVEDIKFGEEGGFERLGNWAAYQLPKGLANFALLGIGGGVGGMAAKGLTSQYIKQGAKAYMERQAAELAAKEAGTQLAAKTARDVTNEALASQLRKNIVTGVTGGGFAASTGVETGSIYGDTANDPNIGPEKAFVPALVAGPISGSLDIIPAIAGAKALGITNWIKTASRQAIRNTIKASPDLSAWAKRLVAAGTGAGAGVALEGPTEALQEVVHIAAARYAKQQPMFGNYSEEEQSQIINSLSSGALIGLVAGGGTGVLTGGAGPNTQGQNSQGATPAEATPAGSPGPAVPPGPSTPGVPPSAAGAPPSPGVPPGTGTPGVPGTSVAPSAPSVPSAPGAPGAPGALSVPSTPNAPSAPGVSGAPGAPVVPPTIGAPPSNMVPPPSTGMAPTTSPVPVPTPVPEAVLPPVSVAEQPPVSDKTATGSSYAVVPAVDNARSEIGANAAQARVGSGNVNSGTTGVSQPNSNAIPGGVLEGPGEQTLAEKAGSDAAQAQAEIGPTSTAEDIKRKTEFVAKKMGEDAFLSTVERVKANKEVTFTKKEAIDAAKSDPRYSLVNNPDGSVSVVGILDPTTNEWVGQKPTESQPNPTQEATPNGFTSQSADETRGPQQTGAEVSGQEAGLLSSPERTETPRMAESADELWSRLKRDGDNEYILDGGQKGHLVAQTIGLPPIQFRGGIPIAVTHDGAATRTLTRDELDILDDAINRDQVDVFVSGRWGYSGEQGTGAPKIHQRLHTAHGNEWGPVPGVTSSPAETQQASAEVPSTPEAQEQRVASQRIDPIFSLATGVHPSGDPLSTATDSTGQLVHPTATDFVAATDAILGTGWTQRAVAAGVLKINTTSAPGSAAGTINRATEKITINLDRMPRGYSAVDALLHEGSHSGMHRLLGDAFTSFHEDLMKLAEQGDETAKWAMMQGPLSAITAINQARVNNGLEIYPHQLLKPGMRGAELVAELKRVRDLVGEKYPDLLPEEDIAYYVQAASNKEPTSGGYWRRLKAAIHAWFMGTGFGQTLARLGWRPELAPQLAVALAKRATHQTLQRAEFMSRIAANRESLLQRVPATVRLAIAPTDTTDNAIVLESRAGDFAEVPNTWYRSGLLDAVRSSQQIKAQPQQWVAWLKKQPNVKQEELDDLGLEDWLWAQDGVVAKGDVEQFVRDGGVRVEEVLKGAQAIPPEIQAQLDDMLTQIEQARANYDYDSVRKLDRDRDVLVRQYRVPAEPRFAAYQVPGGENYRELLVTIPVETRPTQYTIEPPLDPNGTVFQSSWRVVENGQLVTTFLYRNQAEEYLKEVQGTPQAVGDVYRSSHWDEPNVLVHLRFNERMDANGKRVLFVEEVQSDWNQEGRKKGYRNKWTEADSDAFARLNTMPDAVRTVEQQQELDRLFAKKGATTPNAPMKSTSTWAMLGMKRAIRWAAENGFDAVAWTPGQIQFDRYGSEAFIWSKRKNENGWLLRGKGQQGGDAFAEMENQLAEIAIQRGEVVETRSDVRNTVEATMQRDSTEYGPTQWEAHITKLVDRLWIRMQEEDVGVMLPRKEGMEGFYDRSLPNELNRYGKKFGARVQTTEIEGSQQVWSLPITPALREEAIAGQLLYALPFNLEVPTSWFTSSSSPDITEVRSPGTSNKIFHAMVDRFHYVQGKSSALYRAFDEWKNRQGALMDEIERMYLKPMRQMVAHYEPTAKDIELIQRMRQEYQGMPPDTPVEVVEVVGHQLAARHVVLDNVNEQLATRAAPRFLRELRKQLSPSQIAQLNADIKTQMGPAKTKLTDAQVRTLFEQYLPLANPTSTIGVEWSEFKRRASGMSTAVPGSIESKQDLTKGFLNAYEVYSIEVQNRNDFKKIAELSDKLAAHQLRLRVEGELMSQTSADTLSQAYPHYVPTRRELFDYDKDLAEIFERPGRHLGAFVARKGASDSGPIIHVLQNHLAAGFTAAAAAAKNQMMGKFADTLYTDVKGWEPWFSFTETRKNNGSMGLVYKGKELYINPASDNMRAAAIAKVINGLDAQELAGPTKIMQGVNNWIRWSNVSASPLFWFTNTPRDYLTARYNLKASDATKYASEIGSWKNYKAAFKALKTVLLDGVRQSADPTIQQWIQDVKDFEESGAKTSFVEGLKAMDGSSWKSFEAQVNRRRTKAGPMIEFGRNALEWIESVNIVLENTMRFSTYKVMKAALQRDQGLTEAQARERAAEISRNLTTNFSRRGASIDTINVWWLFYNATVQGNWQVVQNMFLNPNKAGARRLQKAVVGTIIFAFILDQLGRAGSDDEDDDGINDWDARSPADKERKISAPFKIGGVYPSIPSPWVFNVFWRMGGMLGEVMAGVTKPQDAVLDSIGMTLSTLDPVGGLRALTGSSTWGQAVSPSAFDPFMQMIENRDFMGNPLGPTGYPGASARPDAYMAWDSTPGAYKHAAEFVNEVFGGNEVESSIADFRPSSYKILAEFAMGSLGRTMLELGQLAASPFTETKEFENWGDLPIIKVFGAAPSDGTAISLYHDRVAQVLGAKRLVKEYSDGPNQNPEKLRQVQQDRAAVLRLVPQVEDVERQIRSLRKSIRSAQVRNDSRTGDLLRERITQLQHRFNQSFVRQVE